MLAAAHTHRKVSKPLEKRLLKAALSARENAYCPYSGYKVGASALAVSGRIYSGANVENSSYGLTVCAERAAIFSAVCAGERELAAVCVAAKAARPCGACRQVMSEFLPKDAPVLIASVDDDGKTKVIRRALSEILPMAFDPGEAGL
ncbi:MAG: cytidine deaminase [Elusimicrobiales bacterium]